jgi:hypothetical protein
MRKLVAIACAVLTSMAVEAQGPPTPGELEETFEMMREFMSTERETMLESDLRLTRAERRAFWPLYEKYRAEIATAQDRLGQLLAEFAENYADPSDEQVGRFVDEYFAIEQRMLEIRVAYLPAFREILPAQKVARFVQIESKVDGIARLPLIMDTPLIGDRE